MDAKALYQTIALAKKNDQKAFALLFDAHWDYVYGYLLKQTKNENLTEELALRTMTKAFDKIALFNIDLNFKTWLITISKNIHIDHHRREKSTLKLATTSIEKEHFQGLFDDQPSPEDLLIINQNLKQLNLKIKELKPVYGELIKLRYFQELSYKEIADKTLLPMNTIKVTLLRAKKILAKKIEEHTWDG